MSSLLMERGQVICARRMKTALTTLLKGWKLNSLVCCTGGECQTAQVCNSAHCTTLVPFLLSGSNNSSSLRCFAWYWYPAHMGYSGAVSSGWFLAAECSSITFCIVYLYSEAGLCGILIHKKRIEPRPSEALEAESSTDF